MGLIYYGYLHARPDGSIFYVGKGKGRRAWDFSPKHRSPRHREIMREYGVSTIQVSLIYAETETEAFAIEREWISSLQRAGIRLINLTEGGEGVPLTPEMIKQRAATLRATNLLPEVKRRRSKTISLRYQDPEYKERFDVLMATVARRPDVLPKKQAAIERVRADPEIETRRIKSMKLAFSKPEYRELKRQISLKGGNRPPTYHGGDHPMAKKVICIETGTIFPTVRAAIAWLKANGSSRKAEPCAIVAACRGRQKSAYKFHWKYVKPVK